MGLFHLFVLYSFVVTIGAISGGPNRASNSSRPGVVNIGSLLTYNSTIGRVAKLAIELAVEDVNADSNVLAGTKLNLIMQDTNCSGFLGIVEALQLLEEDVVAIIGPQTSPIAHAISHVVNEFHVPLLSFAATDPELASLQYPYFMRMTQSDYFQMNAIADMIDYYGWVDVIAIFVDDDYGRGGITALGDALAKKHARISYKAAIPPDAQSSEIDQLLVDIDLLESRVFVVHVNPGSGLMIFSIAKFLGMISRGYVWIATDWLASVVDSSILANRNTMNLMQGTIVLRHHTPDSYLKEKFMARWSNMLKDGDASSGLNTYGLYAYDSVWLVAHAIDKFLNDGRELVFSSDPRLRDTNGSGLHLSTLRFFDGGAEFLKMLSVTNFTGLTGQVAFNSDGSLIHPAYDVLNIGGSGYRRIGYWSDYSGFSVLAPEVLYGMPPNKSRNNHRLYSAIWPGETTTKPRGWIFANNGQSLRIGVPYRISYEEFVSKNDGPDIVTGFSIDVFKAAIALLPYPVPCTYILFGDGVTSPNYDDLVQKVADNYFDAAVGDISIVTNRTKIVDFTQPYNEAGLVIVARVKEINSNAWSFLKPFTIQMWCVTGAFFLFVGAVIWILEHRMNTEFRGSPRQQLATMFWFSFSTMFFAHRENTVSTLGRFVLIIWLFVVLIINSSYTASMTSILTLQQLSSGVRGLDSLISSSDPIGYQVGSFAKNHLLNELGISESRLVPLQSPDDYANALNLGPKGGGVAAIVDELPYVELFLSSYCNFKRVGDVFTRSGWGFVFQKESPLVQDLSTAILELSENGDLQKLHEKWIRQNECQSQDSIGYSNWLSLGSFWGLFLICGLSCIIALAIFFTRICCQYLKYKPEEGDSDSAPTRKSNRRLTTLRSFKELIDFVDKKEDKVKSSKRKMNDRHNQVEYCSEMPTLPHVSLPVV